MIRVGIYITESQKEALEKIKLQNGDSESRIIRIALDEYLNKK